MAIKTSWAAGDVLAAADLTDTFAAKLGTLTVNAQTGTTYTLTTTDPQKVVTMTNAAASAVTVPTNAAQAVTIGSQIEIVNLSTGVACTVAPAGGVTLHGGSVVLSPGSSVTVAKIGTDVWMVQGQGAPGLTLLATQTFSAASAVSVNNCFTSTYDNYRVMLRLTANSADAGLTMRLRVGGADSSTSIYYAQSTGGYNSTSQTFASGAVSSWEVATPKSTLSRYAAAAWDVMDPATAVQTLAVGTSTFYDFSSPNRWTMLTRSCWHDTATAYDGFSLLISSGTVSGSLSVYGYKK